MERLAEILALLTDEARAGLTDEEVGALHEELTAIFDAAVAGEVEGIQRDLVDDIRPITEGIKVLRVEADGRIEKAVAAQAEIDALAAEIAVPEAEGETLDESASEDEDDAEKLTAEDEATDEAEAPAEPVAATTERSEQFQAASDRLRQMARTTPRPQAPADDSPLARFVRLLSNGQPVGDLGTIEDEMVAARSSFGHTPPGFQQKVAIGRMKTFDYDSDTDFRNLDKESAAQAIASHIDTLNAQHRGSWGEAVTASGGWCAPKETIYDLLNISQAARPVEDSLPSYVVRRGGVSWTPAPKLSTISTSTDGTAGSAVSRLTAAEDEAGTPTKPHQRIDCPTQIDEDLEIMTKILEFGNLIERSWPELVRHFNELVLAAHARMAETLLLTKIGTSVAGGGHSLQVTGGPSTLGAVPTVLSQINRSVAETINVNRMSLGSMFRCYLPAWFVKMCQDDLAFRGSSQPFNELFGANESDLRSWFSQRNVNVTFYEDGETSQMMTAQGNTPVVSWPDTVISYLFPEGSWVHLTGGELDLGVVRDSTLNETNDFQVFSETFENVAFFGWAGTSKRIVHTLNASGAAAGTVTPVTAGS